MTTSKLDLKETDLKLILNILQKYLEPKTQAWIFGSRVKGTARKYSDVDIAIDMNANKIPLDILSELNFDLEQSDLPIKVDIVDWNSISSEFRQLIAEDRIEIAIPSKE